MTITKIGELIAIVLSCLAFIISFLTLALTVFPQINPWNMNHEQKAFAGNVGSQFFLADYYYEIGDYSKSIFWYKIIRENTSDNNAVALNNLGYLYSSRLGLVENEIKNFEEEALGYYLKARNIGCKYATLNAYLILYNNDVDRFPDYDYEVELSVAEQLYYDAFGKKPEFDSIWNFEKEIHSQFPMTTYTSDNEKLVSRGYQTIREGQTTQDYINNPRGNQYYVYALYIATDSKNTQSELYSPVSGDESYLNNILNRVID